MYINPTLFGAKISDTPEEITYHGRPFSLTGKIMDQNGVILGYQKRTSWWRLNFDLVTDRGTYKLRKTLLDYHLEHESGESFCTHGGIDFYEPKMMRVTQLHHSKKFGKYWELSIINDQHWHALLLASITICKLSPAT